MTRTLFYGIIAGMVLMSCNNSSDQTTANSADSSISSQSNADSAPSNANTASAANNSTPGESFKKVMNKMMNDMRSMQMTDDPDHDFATMMKMHHQGAIDMSNIELSKGTNADLKQVAQKTIDDSQKDINDLNTFLGSHQPSKKSDFSKNQMDKMMKSMNMDMSESGDVDKDFVMMMTMHHQKGIDMAKDYLKVGTAAETKKVANNTIKSNSEGIKKLKAAGGGDDMKGMDMKAKKSSDMKDKDMDMKNMDMKDMKKGKPATDHSKHQQ